jgi:hypothetical protein
MTAQYFFGDIVTGNICAVIANMALSWGKTSEKQQLTRTGAIKHMGRDGKQKITVAVIGLLGVTHMSR